MSINWLGDGGGGAGSMSDEGRTVKTKCKEWVVYMWYQGEKGFGGRGWVKGEKDCENKSGWYI